MIKTLSDMTTGIVRDYCISKGLYFRMIGSINQDSIRYYIGDKFINFSGLEIKHHSNHLLEFVYDRLDGALNEQNVV